MNDSEFWGQSWWQGVGGLFGILAFIVGVIALIITIRQDRKKKLSYKVLYSESLFNISEQVKNDIKITFQGQIVDQLHILKIQIINNGKIAITKNDFGGQPIIFKLKNYKNIINFTEGEFYPENLDPHLDYNFDNNEMLIHPLLLNPNDYFNVQVTFDGESRDFILSARIEGVNHISPLPSSDSIKLSEITKTTTGIAILSAIIGMGAIILFFVFAFITLQLNISQALILPLTFFVIYFIIRLLNK